MASRASLVCVPIAFRIRNLSHKSEFVALVGPGERNTLQQPLNCKRAGLPPFGDGLDNLRPKIGEPQEPANVRVTQAEAASNLCRVGISPLSQCEHPRPCSRERENEFSVDAPGSRVATRRNEDLPCAREAQQTGRP